MAVRVFASIGCALCHVPTMNTGLPRASTTSRALAAAMSNQAVNLYSDLLVHHMGAGLADGITQGGAGPDEFRTAPLWGLGQRVFFLHDGRTANLIQAIQYHASTGSEASQVVQELRSPGPPRPAGPRQLSAFALEDGGQGGAGRGILPAPQPHHSASATPEPPISAGMSFIFGLPSWMSQGPSPGNARARRARTFSCGRRAA